MPKNTVPEIGHNLKIRFDVNYIYVTDSSLSPSFPAQCPTL